MTFVNIPVAGTADEKFGDWKKWKWNEEKIKEKRQTKREKME